MTKIAILIVGILKNMPHIHLETTADLPENAYVPDILEALVQRLASFESISSERIKARHLLCSNWVMGAGAPAGFAHCTVAILAGREAALRERIAESIHEIMRDRFHESLEAGEVSVTVEIREMDRGTYRM